MLGLSFATEPAAAAMLGAASSGDTLAAWTFDSESPPLSLEGATLAMEGLSGPALRLSAGGQARLSLGDTLNSRAGTIAFWVKPSHGAKGSQTYVALRWNGAPASYLAITQGWWEPLGQDRLYFILSNEDGVHCSVKYRLPEEKWSHLAAVWPYGTGSGCVLYVNGERLAQFATAQAPVRATDGPLHLGTDAPTTVARGRAAQALIDDLVILRRAASGREIAAAYQAEVTAREGDVAGLWVDEARGDAAQKAAPTALGASFETRAIFHEDIAWALSRAATDKIVQRVAAAGFNVYMPCAWYGPGARFPSSVVPADPKLAQRLRRGDDPLTYLIETAHAAGIDVHACLTIARRGSTLFPEFAGPDVPDGSYDLHNPSFRALMVELASEIVRRYDVDGLNLDYIRTIGLCASASCVADYRQRTGRDLAADIRSQPKDQAATRALTQWNVEAVTALVRDLSQAVRAIRPNVVISVDGHPDQAALLLQGQDSIAWANQGLVDLVYDMSYQRVIDLDALDEVRRRLENPEKLAVMLANYDQTEGQPVPRTPDLLARYVALVRERWPGKAIAIYNYQQLNDALVEGFGKAIFAPPTP